MHRLLLFTIALTLAGFPIATAAHFAAPAKTLVDYRCNEFQGASKDICMRNQLRVVQCSGLKGIYKRECMEKNKPFRGEGRFRRFTR